MQQEQDDFDEPDPDSDFDYEESNKKKKKKAPAKTPAKVIIGLKGFRFEQLFISLSTCRLRTLEDGRSRSR